MDLHNCIWILISLIKRYEDSTQKWLVEYDFIVTSHALNASLSSSKLFTQKYTVYRKDRKFNLVDEKNEKNGDRTDIIDVFTSTDLLVVRCSFVEKTLNIVLIYIPDEINNEVLQLFV